MSYWQEHNRDPIIKSVLGHTIRRKELKQLVEIKRDNINKNGEIGLEIIETEGLYRKLNIKLSAIRFKK